MKKQIIVNPVGLKGYEITERMKELMGKMCINESEDKSNSHVELAKIGPDGKTYGVVRENHEYYIKVSNKTSNLVTEDFSYIGGLQNKKAKAYPSYAKAIKHLNLDFKSLAEAYGTGGDINIFENDNLMVEQSGVAGFSQYGGNGFSNEGNLDGNTPLNEEEEEDLYEVELTAEEAAIDEMIAEESHGYDNQYPLGSYGGYDNDGNRIGEPAVGSEPYQHPEEKKSLIQKAKEKLGFKESLEEEITPEEEEAINKQGAPELTTPVTENVKKKV